MVNLEKIKMWTYGRSYTKHFHVEILDVIFLKMRTYGTMVNREIHLILRVWGNFTNDQQHNGWG